MSSKKLNAGKEFELALRSVVGPAANSIQNTKSSSQEHIQKDDYNNTIPDCDNNYDSGIQEITLAKYDIRPLQPQPIIKHDLQHLEELGPTRIGEITKYEMAEMYGRSVEGIDNLLSASYSHY